MRGATLIPEPFVPLSLVGTLGAMYLFGLQPSTILSLMARTIATGSWSMTPFCRDREHSPVTSKRAIPVAGGVSAPTNRLHHHLADGVADCSADSSPVHGDVVGRPVSGSSHITLSVTILISAVFR